MSSPHVERFLGSLKRCLSTPEFLHRFYEDFMASSPEIAAKFRKTDFPRQTRVLADSLYVLANAAQGQPDSPAFDALPRLAERHDRAHLDIRPELYVVWLDCLVKVARAFDPQFDDALEADWRLTLEAGIRYMQERHQPRPAP
jgi:hemoglobin-like flavoprotein